MSSEHGLKLRAMRSATAAAFARALDAQIRFVVENLMALKMLECVGSSKNVGPFELQTVASLFSRRNKTPPFR